MAGAERVVDVIIVVAGTAGLAALREIRKRTKSFLFVNDGPHGTTRARSAACPPRR